MTKELSINLKPSKTDLNLVKEWLIDEYNEFNEGFYCNWQIIEDSFKNKDLIFLNLEKKPIGFIVYETNEISINIHILNIKHEYKNKGFGKEFFEQFSKHAKINGSLVIKLICQPITSVGFWKRMGFQLFPQRGYGQDHISYYKPLIEVLSSSENITNNNVIQLWDCECFEIENTSPKWTWNIELNNNSLTTPIIFPYRVYWHIRWIQNGKILEEGTAHSFISKNSIIHYGDFLYITRLINV